MAVRSRADHVEGKKWDEVRDICLEVVRALSRASDEMARDISQGFVYKMMLAPRVQKAPWPFSGSSKDWIFGRARRFVKTELERDRSQGKKFARRRESGSEEELEQDVLTNLPDKKPGPEDQIMIRDVLCRILAELDLEKPVARYAFLGRFLDEKQFTQLSAETGLTADCLCKICARVRCRVKAHLAGDGLDQAGLIEMIHELERHRGLI